MSPVSCRRPGVPSPRCRRGAVAVRRSSTGPCQAVPVRYSEFWDLMEQVFGAAYARSLAQDQVLGELDGRTPLQALDAGEDPRRVWSALCDAMQVPPEDRWLKDPSPDRDRSDV